MVVVVLNQRRRIVVFNLVGLGTATGITLHAREVFRPVIALAGTTCAIMHNHPSGSPSPSLDDMRLTELLQKASHVLDRRLFDHVIIGERRFDPLGVGWYSFRQALIL
jgi:DNA repair protein RadC